MELINTSIPARVSYVAVGVDRVLAGKRYKIETSPLGVDILDIGPVPHGKVWVIRQHIAITEEDA